MLELIKELENLCKNNELDFDRFERMIYKRNYNRDNIYYKYE